MRCTVRSRAALAGYLLALLSLLTVTAYGSESEPETRDAREYFFTPTFGDLPEELQAVRDAGKLGMLLFFEADACQYCQHMVHKVFSQKKAQDWFNERFVSITVDIHGDVELTDFDGITLPSKVFSDHRRVFLTPVIAFVDLEGNEVYRHLGMIRTAEELLLLGDYVAGKHHYLMEYKTFVKQRGAEEGDGVLVTPAGESE